MFGLMVLTAFVVVPIGARKPPGCRSLRRSSIWSADSTRSGRNLEWSSHRVQGHYPRRRPVMGAIRAEVAVGRAVGSVPATDDNR